jgi:hypothetical protein
MAEEHWASQGARLTAEAIKTTARHLPSRHYEIRLIHDDRQNYPVLTRHFTRVQLLKSVSFLRRKNADGYHVFFRPDAQHFVFVDDVCSEDIQSMIDDGVRPALVYATSEDLHHAWVQLANLSNQVTEDEARQARVILAERYSGDKGATGKNQLGRLPGFRNVKPMHEDDEGGHPLVKINRSRFAPLASGILKEAKRRVASAPKSSPSAPSWGRVKTDLATPIDTDFPIEIYDHGRHIVTLSAKYEIGDVKTAYIRVLDEMKSRGYVTQVRVSGSGVDRSKQDIAVAHYLISNCVSKNDVFEVLRHGSEKAAERGMDYVIRTVNSACRCPLRHV